MLAVRAGDRRALPGAPALSAQAFQSCAWIRAAIEEPEGLIKQGAERPELRRLLFTGQAALREGGRDPRTRVMHAREGVDSSGGGQQAQHDPGTRQDRSVALAEHIVRATGRPRAHDYDSGRQWPKQCDSQAGRDQDQRNGGEVQPQSRSRGENSFSHGARFYRGRSRMHRCRRAVCRSIRRLRWAQARSPGWSFSRLTK